MRQMDTLKHNFIKGFTLVELMVTVSVLSILVAIAAPSFTDILVSMRMRSAAYDLVSDLVLARSEALKRGTDVTITPAATGWAGGWTVTSAVVDADPVSTRSALGAGVVFESSSNTVVFDKNGRIANAVNVTRFSLAQGSTNKRCISLDPSGRPKSSKSACPL
jgi:type IV fimbrial biogenesis protein FimT